MTRRVFTAVLFVALVPFALSADKVMTFDVYKDAGDEFRWRLKDGEGTIVATSGQGYKAKADCTKMVENFKTKIDDYTFEMYEDNKMETRFRMKAKNGQTVGSSNVGYAKKQDAEKVVEAIKKGVKDAKVNDETKK